MLQAWIVATASVQDVAAPTTHREGRYVAPIEDVPITQAGAESSSVTVADAVMSRAFKALVVDSAVAQAGVGCTSGSSFGRSVGSCGGHCLELVALVIDVLMTLFQRPLKLMLQYNLRGRMRAGYGSGCSDSSGVCSFDGFGSGRSYESCMGWAVSRALSVETASTHWGLMRGPT